VFSVNKVAYRKGFILAVLAEAIADGTTHPKYKKYQ